MLLQTHLILRNALSSIWPMRLGDTPTIFAVAARVSAGEAKPDPQADNLLLMRFQHRDQPLDGSMVGDRPLYIALCKPSCEQLHGRFHRVVLTVHAGFEPRSSKYGAQSIPSALGAKAMAQIAARATLLRHAARADILRLARRTRTRCQPYT
jgi:hypothetical protein